MLSMMAGQQSQRIMKTLPEFAQSYQIVCGERIDIK
jgi:hypothetical protein